MLAYFRKHFLSAMLVLIIVLLVISFAFTVYNRSVMVRNYELKRQSEAMKGYVSAIFGSTLRQIDLGLRGYALTRNEQLLNPYHSAIQANEANLFRIDSLLVLQQLDSLVVPFAKFKEGMRDYISHSKHMRDVAEQGDLDEFVRLLNMDKGYDLWVTFSPINNAITRYEDELVEKSQAQYKAALNGNVIFQLLLMLLAVPTLASIIYRLRHEVRNRNKLLSDFRESNKKYIFDPGDDTADSASEIDAKKIIEDSTQNLIKASDFIKSITEKNYGVNWEGLTDANKAKNETNLVGQLITMRDEMRRVNKADSERMWVTEGLARFSEVVRNNQSSVSALSDAVVRFLAMYIKAQQASLFILEEEDEGQGSLVLSACYAFDKKKFVERKIEIGSGMIGQAFLEGNTTVLTDLPQRYLHITSGLGEASPRCLVLVPMKYNEKVECILEMASFEPFAPHQIQFLEKAGEFVASSIYSVKITEHTGNLLQQSHENMEMLRAQEEEMRQNMEELQATQEEMTRKEREINRILEEARASEKQLREQLQSVELRKDEEIERLRKLIPVER